MLVPGWILLATAVVVVGAVVALCLVLRRALTELFFWRGAYRCSGERARELLAAADRAANPLQHGTCGAADTASSDRPSGGVRSVRSLLRRYDTSTESIRRAAANHRIDWVSDDDRDYFRAQHDVGPDTDPGTDVIARFTREPVRAERNRG